MIRLSPEVADLSNVVDLPSRTPETDTRVARLVQEADLRAAQQAHAEAREEADRCARICDLWTGVCGVGVWREGHPCDRSKLYDLRRSREREAIAADHVLTVLSRGLSDA
jgi:hypothetical protein